MKPHKTQGKNVLTNFKTMSLSWYIQKEKKEKKKGRAGIACDWWSWNESPP